MKIKNNIPLWVKCAQCGWKTTPHMTNRNRMEFCTCGGRLYDNEGDRFPMEEDLPRLREAPASEFKTELCPDCLMNARFSVFSMPHSYKTYYGKGPDTTKAPIGENFEVEVSEARILRVYAHSRILDRRQKEARILELRQEIAKIEAELARGPR